MGGFLFNGCGASDSYKTIKELKQGYCKSCRKDRMFVLSELKRKIRIFWIPTFTISTKYAVICQKCKEGYYVDDDTRNQLLSGRMHVSISDSGIEFVKKETHTGW